MTSLLSVALLACCAYGQFMYAISNISTAPLVPRIKNSEVTLVAGPGYLGHTPGNFTQVASIRNNKLRWNDGTRLFFQNDGPPEIQIYVKGKLVYRKKAQCNPRDDANNAPFFKTTIRSFGFSLLNLEYKCTFITAPPAPSKKIPDEQTSQ